MNIGGVVKDMSQAQLRAEQLPVLQKNKDEGLVSEDVLNPEHHLQRSGG